MDNQSGDHFLVIKATIDAKRQYSYEKMKTYDFKLDNLTTMMEKMMYRIQISNSSPYNMDSPKS